jgi:hypothetical protein
MKELSIKCLRNTPAESEQHVQTLEGRVCGAQKQKEVSGEEK